MYCSVVNAYLFFFKETKHLLHLILGCADPVFPSVNARISSAADWISQTVCDISDADHADLKDFACKPKRGWLYNLFHPRHPNDISSQLTMGIGGDTEGVQMVHHVFFFGIVAVAVAVAVMKMRKFNEGFSARSERQPLKKIVSNNGTETYDSL